MTDSWSAGNTALPESKEKTTAQSAPNNSAPADERALRPGDAHATEAAKDSVKHAIAAENQTPQSQSRWFWGSRKGKKKVQQQQSFGPDSNSYRTT